MSPHILRQSQALPKSSPEGEGEGAVRGVVVEGEDEARWRERPADHPPHLDY